MIKINLLKDHSAPIEKSQPSITAPKIPLTGYVYIAVVIAAVIMLGYLWISSGNAVKVANDEKQRLERDLKAMEDLRKMFVELEQKQRERQGRIDIISKLLESQKGPVKLLNAVIQSIPQNDGIWLTSLEQTGAGVKVKGATRIPEVLPDFMKDLEKSGIFTSVDIEQIERRYEVSYFSIVCTGK